MPSSPFKALVLPAVLVSGTVFAVLMLILVDRKPVSSTLDPLTVTGDESLLPGDRQYLVVRQVGFAVLISAGAGIATAEVLRKARSFHNSAEAKAEALGLTPLLSEVPPESLEHEQEMSFETPLPELPVEASLPTMPDIEREAIAEAIDEPRQGADSSLLNHDPFQSEPLDWNALSATSWTPELAGDRTPTANSLDAAVQTITPQILEPQQYRTCRIRVAGFEQRRYAILVADQYYGFVRLEATKGKALKLATRLAQRGDRTIMTQTKNGYAIWVLEPQAYPDGSTYIN
ncbi:hypothetical protein H6F43_20490 [Leptolyngbya sp. FACHB-36]|uniref:hypothetical protein n=1 Tax=Leptolyngbya sp. FACHB-36 TaxID=2692808 RepID=UPI001680908D|nr:hypothetical protein [Leptolyngbya sp. FACHB-36]MBD2022564.1 hypothetical protein [Leptolyngbya sp. FACHB-36]